VIKSGAMLSGINGRQKRCIRGACGEGDHSEELSVDGRILKCIFNKWDGEARTGLLWFRTTIGDDLLCMR
jgi:hypothetical protein